MKKAYKKPLAKVIDFEYDTQVTATSPGGTTPPGFEQRPDNPYYCQYMSDWASCLWVVSPSIGCDMHVPGLTSL